MAIDKRKQFANKFVSEWQDGGKEIKDTETFWDELFTGLLGIQQEQLRAFRLYQDDTVVNGQAKHIDIYLPTTRIIIEQKGSTHSLDDTEQQSDKAWLTPYQQAKRYDNGLPFSKKARWIVTCNFKEFRIYDMDKPRPEKEFTTIKLEDLPTNLSVFDFMKDSEKATVELEQKVSVKAGEIMGHIYDLLAKQYDDINTPEAQVSLNILCVRLMFCLYAEDADIFIPHSFHDYLAKFPTDFLNMALSQLFQILNTKEEERHNVSEALKEFPYTNGGLFEKEIEIPVFTDEIKNYLLDEASAGFNWRGISPTIFGALFESTLNPETRRQGGMHFTSVENIHKVIDSLFLNDLKAEYEQIVNSRDRREVKRQNLLAFQEKLASLRFLDPACGSGNFLTETYLCLRRLENDVIRSLYGDEKQLFGDDIIKVNISQLYGIEINDFAVEVAKTALWIAESQMFEETDSIVQMHSNFLPLKTNAYIHEGDALTTNWNDVIPSTELDYIIGNPPFSGARLMTAEQKQGLVNVFGEKWKNVGNLDFVCGWYKKAADYMLHTNIKAALVSTNSICQGEQVSALWKNLFQKGIKINFAYRTFQWDNEATSKAHVYCIIIGFSYNDTPNKTIVTEKGEKQKANHINAYLYNAPDEFVESRTNPICDVPKIGIGNKPIDGGNYLFTEEEMKAFIKKEPKSANYFRKWIGGEEFINRKYRYCLWLGDCSPAELRTMPECLKRVEAVRKYRLNSKSAGTRKIADKPTRFHVENMPKGTYIVIPEVTSEKRQYVPMGFLTPNILCSNLVKIMPNATIYHFGILTSSVHMAWLRTVAGRLGNGCRYSKDIVYNNFPWPTPTPEQKERIEKTAQAILDARNKYPDSNLADLYDPIGMTQAPELLSAHKANDKAVLAAYGLPADISESNIVNHLFQLYSALTRPK